MGYPLLLREQLKIRANIFSPSLSMKKAQQNVKITGRGGTDFQTVIHHFEKSKIKYDGMIIFTDGYAPKPKMSPRTIRKTLWICDLSAAQGMGGKMREMLLGKKKRVTVTG